MKLLARIGLDIKEGARWAQLVCLLVAILVSIAVNFVIWTHNLPWTELGLAMAVNLAIMLASAKYLS